MRKNLASCGWSVNTALILIEEVHLATVEVFQFLNKDPTVVKLSPWRLCCNFTRTDRDIDLAMEDKSTPNAVSGSSSPLGQGLQHEFQVIPGVEFCYVLGM